MYTCTHIHTHTLTHTCTHARLHTHLYECMHVQCTCEGIQVLNVECCSSDIFYLFNFETESLTGLELGHYRKLPGICLPLSPVLLLLMFPMFFLS